MRVEVGTIGRREHLMSYTTVGWVAPRLRCVTIRMALGVNTLRVCEIVDESDAQGIARVDVNGRAWCIIELNSSHSVDVAEALRGGGGF